MDALTSMAGISGYRAVIEAANAFGRFFNGQITAAGKVPPAKVFIAGAGVAGLAAIGTAASLGAIVRANDTRAEVADQVDVAGRRVRQGRLRGRRLRRRRLRQGDERGLPAGAARDVRASRRKDADIIITTALIPGKPAPKLITAEMVQEHEAGQRDRRHGGRAGRQLRADRARARPWSSTASPSSATPTWPSRLAKQSSTLYSNNLLRLTEELCKTKDGVDRRQHGRRRDPRPHGASRTAASPGRRRRPSCRPRRRKPQAGRGRRCPRPRGTATARGEPMSAQDRWPSCSASARCCSCSSALYAPASLPVALHRVRAGLLRRLHGDLERDAGAAHAADERDQRDLVDHRHRRAGPDRAAARRRRCGSADDADPAGWPWSALALTAINMFGGFAVTRRMLAMFRK